MLVAALGVAALLTARSVRGQDITDEDIILDNMPDDVIAGMEARQNLFASLPPSESGEAYFAEDLLRWDASEPVRVAFLGGNTELHQRIVEATDQITESCNIRLDFGFDSGTGQFRTWSTSDGSFAAEIRVSFDQAGYFSLVGRDSINRSIGSPIGAVGGRPNQRSLNLGGFDQFLPSGWQKTTRHEFLHALAFHHEHSSPDSGCDSQFRWENDPGYVPTQDAQGRYVNDSQGRRPGIYTYLAGYPNFWSRGKVDHNLRQAQHDPQSSHGPFDRASIMLYRFPALFYVSSTSHCIPLGAGQDLSQGDIAGLLHLYPVQDDELEVLAERKSAVMRAIQGLESVDDSVKANIEATLE